MTKTYLEAKENDAVVFTATTTEIGLHLGHALRIHKVM